MRDLPNPTEPLADLRSPLTHWHPILRQDGLRQRQERDTPDGFHITWARHLDEVRHAQRLRHLVFVQEMGAKPTMPNDTPEEHEADDFDAHCEHLLVRPRLRGGSVGPVVGTYRVLTPAGALRAGGLYSDTEFDLSPLDALRPRMAELGRTCVHPAWRTGATIMALWAALADFMRRNALDSMIGCASVEMRDGGHAAASLWTRLRLTHSADDALQVQPRLPLPVDDLDCDLSIEAPALIRGYLKCGAKLLGRPAWDPVFQTADLPLLTLFADVPPRYRRALSG